MSYTAPIYPTDIPDYTDLREVDDDVDSVLASDHNDLMKELVACLDELGTLPKGDYSSVADRLDDIFPVYKDRGDTAAYDFTLASFTIDAAWHDLDLSSIVPLSSASVILQVRYRHTAANANLYFRKKGYTNAQQNLLTTQVANQTIDQTKIVACDENSFIQYRSNGANQLDLLVSGWFK